MTPSSSPSGSSGRSGLFRSLQRLVHHDEPAAADVDTVAPPHPTRPLAECPLRRPVEVEGSVSVVTVNPVGSHRWLEAELTDPTGEVVLIWMGRRRVAGIDAGRRLRVNGVITLESGRRVIYNPRYELLAS